MANPYSPSTRPILSNPLASALSGLASGGLQGYQLKQQRQLQQQNQAYRQQQLAIQQEDAERKNAVEGYTPGQTLTAGVPQSDQGGLSAALRSAAGISGDTGIAGVLPSTDMRSGLPPTAQSTIRIPGGINFANSAAGQRASAQFGNAETLEDIKNRNAINRLGIQYQNARGMNQAQYGDLSVDPKTGKLIGNPGNRNAITAAGFPLQQQGAQSLINFRKADIGIRQSDLGLRRQAEHRLTSEGVVNSAATVDRMRRSGQGAPLMTENQIDNEITKARINGYIQTPEAAAQLKEELRKAGMFQPNTASGSSDPTDDRNDPYSPEGLLNGSPDEDQP